jgi:hypothetical protein
VPAFSSLQARGEMRLIYSGGWGEYGLRPAIKFEPFRLLEDS